MELDVGRQCSLKSCKQLDFLPFKCPACSLSFCENHWKPGDHSCVKRREYELKRDNKTIDCPVCSLPISIPFGQDPNIYVDEHIRKGCKKVEIYPHKCSVEKCNQKVAVRIKCKNCNKNYCLKHRFPGDHNCAKKVSNVNNTDTCGIQ
ncbi:hypothetical protein ROZALSC1DRAFT_11542 [Rozella allomycis CSF55]|uniref:AN1-type domain-containing protein n=1 Tax=Rozella allomycis (strain CSF55) TaxID=988480 RepID=A0A4P9YQK7_ROZAC|nr:hypothetical protein ROZALSC1DRAFT_11542 [Rozella allomycis CSF55]